MDQRQHANLLQGPGTYPLVRILRPWRPQWVAHSPKWQRQTPIRGIMLASFLFGLFPGEGNVPVGDKGSIGYHLSIG